MPISINSNNDAHILINKDVDLTPSAFSWKLFTNVKIPAWVGSPDECTHALQHIRATLAIFGSVLIWLGAWNLLTERRRTAYDVDDDAPTEMLQHHERTALFCVFGYLMVVWADSITFTVGCWSNLWSPKLWGHGTKYELPLKCLRWLVSFIGQIMVWVGVIDFFDFYVTPAGVTWEREVIYMLVGVIGVIMTNTHEHMAYVYSDAELNRDVVTHQSPLKARLFELFRCSMALIFQCLIWLALWNLFLRTTNDFNLIVAQTLAGLVCLLFTRSYVVSSWGTPIITEPWDKQEEGQTPQARNVLHYIRVMMSACGYLTYWNGLYMIFYEMMGSHISIYRNLIAITVGIVFCIMGGSFWSNSITLYADDEEEGDEEEEESSSSSSSLEQLEQEQVSQA